MASIRREVSIRAQAERLWDALRDVGALHTRLVPGFVTGCTLDGSTRTVTFANGIVAQELIVTVDAEARRVVWSSVGGRLTHHNASAQVLPEGPNACRVVWIADLLPDELAPAVATMIEHGLAAMQRHAEQAGAGVREAARAAPPPAFDAAQYKNAQREQWNQDGPAWRRWTPTLDRWYGAATRRMLDLARLQPGQRVLDVAAGAGEPAVSAAERVGPRGHVLATDISEGIVELARQVARERGLEQIETRAMDGEQLDLPDAAFDAVLCRLGLMYMPHPVTALREWRRVLKAGGRVAVVVFSTPDRNPWGAVPAGIIRRRAQLAPPAPGQPGPFALGAPGVLEDVFRQAGFASPEVHAVPAPHGATSAAAYVRVAREAFGGFNAMMARLPAPERESVWNDVDASMRSYESANGFEAPGECLVCAAVK